MIFGGGTALLAAGMAAMLTRPAPLDPAFVTSLPAGDAARGQTVFWAGGCASCHSVPKSEGEARIVLAGGRELETEFGTFVVPNISPARGAGLGGWTIGDFANAMIAGVSPERSHYYPSFPYNSYQKMAPQDLSDLWAFLQTLPPSDNRPAENALKFPFSIRASVGGWKLLFLDASPRVALETDDAKVLRGQYLVEGPGHCGECHTPRNALGGFKAGQWLAGAANPDGEGRIPNITPGAKDAGRWSEAEIVAYLETGFTPEFDSVGGSMVEVQKNMANLPKADLEAIAAYLKAVPAIVE